MRGTKGCRLWRNRNEERVGDTLAEQKLCYIP